MSYYYRVSATTTIGEGPLSNVASGHTSSGGQAVASLEFGTIALVLAAIGAIVVAVLLLRRRGKS